jgi:hypothetical protein
MSTEQVQGTAYTFVSLGDLVVPSFRLNPAYFEQTFTEVEDTLRALGAVPLGRFIPDEHPDGSKGITYGQVGARKLDPRGSVRYLQVINIRETGIDFAIKPDRVAEGSHNDPPRSRVRPGDVLFTNNAFRDTETLLGRCVAVVDDLGKVNISQHIDRIRVAGINPFYICCFLKCKYGSGQIQRMMHGVDSTGISFGRIRELLIPVVSMELQQVVENQYVTMSKFHERGMAVKERLLQETRIAPGQYGEAINSLAMEKPAYRRAMHEAKARLDHLIAQLDAVIEKKQKSIKPYPR